MILGSFGKYGLEDVVRRMCVMIEKGKFEFLVIYIFFGFENLKDDIVVINVF